MCARAGPLWEVPAGRVPTEPRAPLKLPGAFALGGGKAVEAWPLTPAVTDFPPAGVQSSAPTLGLGARKMEGRFRDF